MNKKIVLFLAVVFILSAACGVGMLPSRDPWYAKHYFVMQDFERKAYKKLTAEGRSNSRLFSGKPGNPWPESSSIPELLT